MYVVMDRTIKLCLIFGFITQVTGVEMTSLDQVVNRLEAIEVKLAKVDALFGSLDQLCKSLNVIQTQFDDQNVAMETVKQDEHKHGPPDKVELKHADEVLNKVNKKEKHGEGIEVESIELSGVQNEEVNVTVVITATKGCLSEWFCVRHDEHQTRSIGQIEKDDVQEDIVRYKFRNTLHDIDTIQEAYLMIYSNSYNAMVQFNIKALNVSGTQHIDADKKEILEFSPKIIVPGEKLQSQGFNTTVTVSENVVNAMNGGFKRSHPELYMTLFNTTVTPPSFEHVWSDRYDSTPLSVHVKDGTTNKLMITLDKSHAVYGGIITLRIQQNVSGFLIGFDYGIEIRLINEDVGDVMPYGGLGLYRIPDKEYVKGPYLSISCVAYGIPFPSLKILKRKKNGSLTELKSDYDLKYDFYHTKVLQFDPTKSVKPEGEYVCQASNGNDTIEHEMSYETYQRVAIDDNKTGLTKNSTKKTVVTCKATGNPIPELALHAETEYGRNLLEDRSDQFKHKFSTKKRVIKVTLVIAPPDEAIRDIYCVARQGVWYAAIQETKGINIFPSVSNIKQDVFNSTEIDKRFFRNFVAEP